MNNILWTSLKTLPLMAPTPASPARLPSGQAGRGHPSPCPSGQAKEKGTRSF